MKKLFILIALLIISALILTACGGGNAGGSGGGNAGFDTSRNITVLAREDGSGTKSAFMDIIGLRGQPDPANAIIQASTAAVNTEVKGNAGAIAYESLGFVTPDVKILKVDGVEATVANINDGSYKIARPLAVVYQNSTLDNNVNRAFFNFMQSSAALNIINENGFVPVASDTQEYTIDGSLSGSIDISGSTSVQPLMIELAAAFENLQPNVRINVSGGGSCTGYNNAEEGVSDFGMISEEFNQERAQSCVFMNIAKDGIAVIVHSQNPLDNITMEQLGRIFDGEAGENAITVWSELITE